MIECLESRKLFAVSVQNLGVEVSDFSQPVAIGSTVYFAGKMPGNYDWELWKTDGTVAGTSRVADVFPGTSASSPMNLTNVNGTLFFTTSGGQLYKSNGTAAGTTLVKAFSGSGAIGGIRSLIAFNNKLFFAGYQPNDGASDELWSSDGTAAGTQRVADISPGPYGSSIGGLTVWNNRLVFYASSDPGTTAVHGVELFSSDGTAAGTRMIKDINPGIGNSVPFQFVPFNGKLYFSAYTKAEGVELWSTDGTAANTKIFKDLLAGSKGSYATPALVFNNALYVATSGYDVPQTLYKIDTAGTLSAVSTFDPNSTYAAAYSFADMGNGKMVFTANTLASGVEPWVSNGTAGGTARVKDVIAGKVSGADATQPVVGLNGYGFFVGMDDKLARQLYATDGTAAGTTAVPGTNGTGMYTRFTVAGNRLFLNTAANNTGMSQLVAVTVTRPTPPVATGTLSGFTFDDTNKNGKWDTGEAKTAGKTVFLDLDNDNQLDSNEKKTTTASDGSWSFTGLAAGAYRVRRVFPSGYTLSTTPIDVTLAAGQVVSGLSIGSKSGTTPPATDPKTASITGYAFDDTNKNGIKDVNESFAAGKTIWLDLDDDGVKETGEATFVTGSDGKFSFTGLAARTYHVRRAFPTGYVESTPARYVTLGIGQAGSGIYIGGKAK